MKYTKEERLHLYDENLKLDLRTATYEEIKAVWSTEMTNYTNDKGEQKYTPGVLSDVLKEYFAQCE